MAAHGHVSRRFRGNTENSPHSLPVLKIGSLFGTTVCRQKQTNLIYKITEYLQDTDITYEQEKLCTSNSHRGKPCISIIPNGFNFQFKTAQTQNSKRAIKTVTSTRLFLKLRNLLKELLCSVTTLPTTSRPSAYHSQKKTIIPTKCYAHLDILLVYIFSLLKEISKEEG